MCISRLVPPGIFQDLLQDVLLICPNQREPQYSPSHYLRALIFILKTGCSYRDVLELFPNAPHGHSSTIYKKFKDWTLAGLFYIIYNKLRKIYSEDQLADLDSLDIYIDSTHVRNKYGEDLMATKIMVKKEVLSPL